MLRYLLDTNIVIYVLKRRPVEVLATFNANANRIAISTTAAVAVAAITIAVIMGSPPSPSVRPPPSLKAASIAARSVVTAMAIVTIGASAAVRDNCDRYSSVDVAGG